MKALATIITVLSLAAAGSASAGAVNGPQATTTRVEAHDSDVFNVRFFGGQLARVSIRGDGDTDLDLIIKDRYGNEVCRADGLRDVETCRFEPENTGTYHIEVRNLGNVWNRYRLSIT